MAASAFAPAKTMLFGEHFVVYGEPAMVLAIDKRSYATVILLKDKRIHKVPRELNVSGFFCQKNCGWR